MLGWLGKIFGKSPKVVDDGETISMERVPTKGGTNHTSFLLIRQPGENHFSVFPDNWCLLDEEKRQEIMDGVKEKTGYPIKATG